MSDTCIVCLGDLGESASDPELLPRSDLHDATAKAEEGLEERDQGEIAQLLPCGHIFHHECLKPWVERANSCPICRRNFNMVELSDQPGGTVTSSYAVQDRVQVADLDPLMIIEDDEEPSDLQPCIVCGRTDNEDVMVVCSDCPDASCHVYCIETEEISTTDWYCPRCQSENDGQGLFGRANTIEITTRRHRASQRRTRRRDQVNSLHWARVWQSVWDRLNIDLDFPFHDGDEEAARQQASQRQSEESNQREFRAWQRRFQIAERQGGGNRFRDTASLFDIEPTRPSRPRAPRAPTPEPESLEEMRAWNAFERAREIENNPNAARKRKEPTLSPSPEPSEPQRKLKRPRTRRPQELAALAQENGEPSKAASSSNARLNGATVGEPSFLSSLLKEVEDSSTPGHAASVGPSAPTSVAPTDHVTPGPSSPSISPVSSSHSSPRYSSTTPPPHSRSRPLSPLQLSSPAEPSSPPFSPEISFSGGPDASPTSDDPAPQREAARPRSRIPQRALDLARSRSPDSSPNRHGPSLTVKSTIQRMVGAYIKPHYRKKAVSKEQYTEINRTISRKLYERVGSIETLDLQSRLHLEQIAKREVQEALDSIPNKRKDKQPMAASESEGDVL
ncbi:hypothetical protein N7493_009087 [Penicillium malachiteum]|uniref:PHD and RING finger domain protein n=1 Tax=Penicillium malachiteum TaxID=1324776 RepID=A0AAD6HFU3_9EURO|nr:hypothetical protein N7493_009087 [Penicillium malachiteum]